jgi:hypothetical protein
MQCRITTLQETGLLMVCRINRCVSQCSGVLSIYLGTDPKVFL